MDAIVTAGGIPEPDDPLYANTQGAPKAMLEIAGKPMIQWVLDALSDSKHVNQVVVVGLEKESGVTCTKSLDFIPNQGSMLSNIMAGGHRILTLNPGAKMLLSVSSDIPTITGAIVDWMAEEVMDGEYDVYYNYILRDAMESRFPGSKRTFTKFKGAEVCGGDLNAFQTHLLTADGAVWQELINARKNILKQAGIIGLDLLVKLFLRQLTIDEAAVKASKRLELKAIAVNCPYPEIGMDVDKPYQFELLQNDLIQREAI